VSRKFQKEYSKLLHKLFLKFHLDRLLIRMTYFNRFFILFLVKYTEDEIEEIFEYIFVHLIYDFMHPMIISFCHPPIGLGTNLCNFFLLSKIMLSTDSLIIPFGSKSTGQRLSTVSLISTTPSPTVF
jgi:hypothetical protein